MKNLRKVIALCLSLLLLCTFPIGVSASSDVPDYLIDPGQLGWLTIYKYDITNTEKDGVWDSSYVSTGVYDQSINDAMGADYAIPGVEFSYLKVADIVQFSEPESGQNATDQVSVLYGIDKAAGADFLKAIGLTDGAQRYEAADTLDVAKFYYRSDVLVDALATALEANSTTVKNALESYMDANNAAAMPLTDEYGKTEVKLLPLGLYLVVETGIPEMVVSTVNPFLVSLPTMSVNGTNATDGGSRWTYTVTLYPKNETGVPSLEKTLREHISDFGKNNGSTTDITDGYAHTGTASGGDLIDYQILSTLPTITSESTYLSTYSFVDTLSKGLSYVKDDVVLTFYKDSACTEKITTWAEDSGKFTVTYNTTKQNESVMTIEMTDAGLSEINTAKTVYTEDSMVNAGYSDCTVRVNYQAKVGSDDSVVYGDHGNSNYVVLTWKRSSDATYGTLVDDAHIFTYGIDLTKQFSDGNGNFENVSFLILNKTDDRYIKATLDENTGIYYMTDYADYRDEATRFVPVTSGNANGKIIVKGLEDDAYTIYEEKTDNGYTLLRDGIHVVISQAETTAKCDIYSDDVLALLQNDPTYAERIQSSDDINNISQSNLEHKLLTASATVDSNEVNMAEDNASANAMAPLTVVNTKGFNLPQTGDRGVWMYGVIGILLMAGSVAVFVMSCRKKKNSQ